PRRGARRRRGSPRRTSGGACRPRARAGAGAGLAADPRLGAMIDSRERADQAAVSVWGQMAAIARRDARIQLSYKFDLLLQLEGVAFGVAVTFFIARLVPDVRLRPYSGGYFEFALIGLAASLLAGVGLGAFTSSIDRAQQEGTLEILL